MKDKYDTLEEYLPKIEDSDSQWSDNFMRNFITTIDEVHHTNIFNYYMIAVSIDNAAAWTFFDKAVNACVDVPDDYKEGDYDDGKVFLAAMYKIKDYKEFETMLEIFNL